MQQRLRQTDEELDNLIGVRSRATSRKLRAVQTPVSYTHLDVYKRQPLPRPSESGLQGFKIRLFLRSGQVADICPTFVHQLSLIHI